MSYQAALDYIHSVKWQTRKPGLSRTRALLSALGNPERKLKFVHIAGTNGKGSTAACIASCLRASGYRVGLYTSPYINRFNERIQVNGVPISDMALEQAVNVIRPKADAMADSPSEFELITAIAFYYFLRQRCDIVVLEVGLGGALDSTNVIGVPECAVITAIGLDHMRELGPTLTDIATAKAGIIKPGGVVVSYGGQPEADAVINRAVRERGASLRTVDFSLLTLRDFDLDGITFDFGPMKKLRLPLIGSYQPKNAATAITALLALREKGWDIPDQSIREGLEKVQWPGRFEVLRKQPLFLLDGSHNAHGMQATVESLRMNFPEQRFTFLFAVMADKDVAEMIQLLAPLAERFVTVTADNPRAVPAGELARMLTEAGVAAVAAPSVEAGVALALELAEKRPVCALGTLYFSGDVRRALEALTKEQP
ncbi:MAG: bifunctional folylpolyglutamate synthase/dihydrofolate synthase [Clostridiales bacterium]|nr:bifunctional folylpolyglutamate synthase/dihydrofolate synthase [Clostridiales bacterium]